MEEYIYLDNNATTQPLSEVVEAMLPFLGEQYANPSSLHRFGQQVRHAVEQAREQVAELVGASAKEIVFTGSGTESINLALRGALRCQPDRRRIVTTAVEHSAVLGVAEQLTRNGYTVQYVAVDDQGRLREDEWNDALTDDTALASIIHANNETGVVFDVAHLAAIAAERGAIVHVDAVQSAGKLPIQVRDGPVHLVSLAAHKFHGPKGVGALYVKGRTRIEPLLIGGGQERTLRGGTEHVAGIVGMGVAADAARRDHERVWRRVAQLRDDLESRVLSAVTIASVNGGHAERLYNTTNISFSGLEAEAVLILLSEAGICASSGSACSSGSLEPSHVLLAMGASEAVAHGAVRFSLSRFNTSGEIEQVVAKLPKLLGRLTALSEP